MFGRKSGKPNARIDSLIGAGTRVDGDITFTGGLRIDGTVKGNVRSDGGPGMLVLSENACVEGSIDVTHCVVNGTVIGPVTSSEYLELQPQAKVTGDVTYNRIEIHLGAAVKGRLDKQGDVSKAAVGLKLAKQG